MFSFKKKKLRPMIIGRGLAASFIRDIFQEKKSILNQSYAHLENDILNSNFLILVGEISEGCLFELQRLFELFIDKPRIVTIGFESKKFLENSSYLKLCEVHAGNLSLKNISKEEAKRFFVKLSENKKNEIRE